MTPFQVVLSTIGTLIALAGLLLAIASFRGQGWQRRQAHEQMTRDEAEATRQRAEAGRVRVEGPPSIATKLTELEQEFRRFAAAIEARMDEVTKHVDQGSAKISDATTETTKVVGDMRMDLRSFRDQVLALEKGHNRFHETLTVFRGELKAVELQLAKGPKGRE